MTWGVTQVRRLIQGELCSSVLHSDIPHSWPCVNMTNDSPVSGEGEDSELRAQILCSASSQSIDLFLLHYYLYGAVRKGWRTPMLFCKHRKFFLDHFISSCFPSNHSLCVYTSATEIKVCVHQGFYQDHSVLLGPDTNFSQREGESFLKSRPRLPSWDDASACSIPCQ